MYIEKAVKNYHDYFYMLMRLLVGLMFFLHGYGKVMGDMTGLMWWVGLAELLIGLGVFFGVFTRLSALGGAIIMLVAYFKAHAGAGLSPLANGGELAVVYFVIFLVLMQHGARKWSLEKAVLKKEVF